MLRVINLKIFMFVCYNFISISYGCNYKLLDSNADTFVDRISSNVSSSNKMIGEYIDFLNYEERDNIEQNLKLKNFKSFYKNNINSMKALKYAEFSNFLNNCKFIYEDYEEIEPIIQAAVYMLVERVVQKIDEYELYNTMYKNLPLKQDIKINDKNKRTYDIAGNPILKKTKISEQSNSLNSATNVY